MKRGGTTLSARATEQTQLKAKITRSRIGPGSSAARNRQRFGPESRHLLPSQVERSSRTKTLKTWRHLVGRCCGVLLCFRTLQNSACRCVALGRLLNRLFCSRTYWTLSRSAHALVSTFPPRRGIQPSCDGLALDVFASMAPVSLRWTSCP